MKSAATLFAVGAILAATIPGITPPSDEMVSIGSHRLQVRLEGKGTPAVVIDAGIADRLDMLKPLQERIARVTRVLIYNRAGYGGSEPGPLPRDGGREADELKDLLEKLAVPEPYVLVGHSLGGLNIQVYASRYPEAVTGIVLLDPPPLSFIQGQAYKDLGEMAARMTEQWQSIADSTAKSNNARDRTLSAFFSMIASEHREMFNETARLVGAVSTFGDIPLMVVAAGKPNPAFGQVAGKFQKYWVEQSRTLSEKSTHGRFILADSSSHHLYLDVPDLVEEVVVSMVNEARAK